MGQNNRRDQPPFKRGPMGRGPAMSMPTEKAKDFKGTAKRLFNYLKPFKFQLGLVVIVTVLGTVLI